MHAIQINFIIIIIYYYNQTWQKKFFLHVQYFAYRYDWDPSFCTFLSWVHTFQKIYSLLEFTEKKILV